MAASITDLKYPSSFASDLVKCFVPLRASARDEAIYKLLQQLPLQYCDDNLLAIEFISAVNQAAKNALKDAMESPRETKEKRLKDITEKVITQTQEVANQKKEVREKEAAVENSSVFADHAPVFIGGLFGKPHSEASEDLESARDTLEEKELALSTTQAVFVSLIQPFAEKWLEPVKQYAAICDNLLPVVTSQEFVDDFDGMIEFLDKNSHNIEFLPEKIQFLNKYYRVTGRKRKAGEDKLKKLFIRAIKEREKSGVEDAFEEPLLRLSLAVDSKALAKLFK
ncbi:MAG: hypothetical protein ACR2PT_16010 [Endozoicomonas sp.]